MMDRKQEQQIWQRVYGKRSGYSGARRRELEQCYRRERADHGYYDRFRDDPVYGAAFGRLADEALEHCKMLRQILEK